MVFPSFIKSPHFLGSVGATGAIVAGLCFFNMEEEEHIPEKYFLNLPSVGEFKENRCFLESFSQTWPQNNRTDDQMEVVTTEDISKAKEKVDFPGLEENSYVEGCMGSNLSHNLSSSLWNLSLGLTLKNENAGVALYADGAGKNTSSTEPKYGQILKYNLFLLKKESYSWRIKAGYSWRDDEITGNDLKLYFMDIKGSNLIDAQTRHNLGGIADSGSWKGANGAEGVDMLGQIELKGTKDGKPMILGRKDSFRTKHEFRLSRVYGVDKQEWFESKDPKFDLGGILEEWFTPFMKSKIVWTGNAAGCPWDPQNGQGCSNN